MIAFHDVFLSFEFCNFVIIGFCLVNRKPPGHISTKQNEVAVGNLARPIFAYFRKVVLPTVTENIHGFFDGV